MIQLSIDTKAGTKLLLVTIASVVAVVLSTAGLTLIVWRDQTENLAVKKTHVNIDSNGRLGQKIGNSDWLNRGEETIMIQMIFVVG